MDEIDDPDELDDEDRLDAQVREVAVSFLAEAGPLALDRLVDLLAEAGTVDPLLDDGYDGDELIDIVDDILADTDDFLHTPDGMIAHAATVLDALVLTHRVSQSELDRDVLDITPDLGALDWNQPGGIGLVGGGLVTTEYPFGNDPALAHADTHGSLFGPPGWLDGLSAGDLVTLRREGTSVALDRVEGAVEVADESTDAMVAAVEAAFERHTRGDDTIGAEPEWMLIDLVVHDPSLFRAASLPVAELLDLAGLDIDGAWVGRKGVDWQPPGVRRREVARERLFDRYRFNECCVESFERVHSAWTRFLLDPEGAAGMDARALAKALAHGAVAPAIADDLFDLFHDGSDRLDEFAALLATAATGVAAGAAQYLQGVNAERQGRTLDAEAAFTAAVRSDPDLHLAQLELARYASDRGDAARAVSLFAKAGVPADEPHAQFLRDLVRDSSGVGRNDPCPCGSGRKFKQCHLRGGVPLPIEARSGWLVNKVSDFVLSPAHRAPVMGLASTAVEAAVPDADDDAFVAMLQRLISDPFLLSLAVHEGGGLAAFITRRGELLPADELELAKVWFEERRRLWEATAVDPGVSMQLRDTATGVVVDVAEEVGSANLEVGQYLLAVVVPVDDEHQILGAVLEIPLRLRESVLSLLDAEPTADEIADWYGWSLQPPALVNREGEPTVLRHGRATPSVPWKAFAAALDAEFDATDDQGTHWVEHHTLAATSGDGDEEGEEGEVIVRTFLRRDGDELVVETNSDERWDRVIAALRSIDPGVVVVDESVDDGTDGARPPSPDAWSDWAPLGGGPASAELDAALVEYMLAKETEWLDESIPALGGASPREAADDPTRREDLLALLRSFEVDLPAGAASFDPARIRAALGLDVDDR